MVEEYVFEDQKIIIEMETYHISKEGACNKAELN